MFLCFEIIPAVRIKYAVDLIIDISVTCDGISEHVL